MSTPVVFGVMSSLDLGSVVSGLRIVVGPHCATVGTTICRRHFPVVITTGTFEPAGTPGSSNRPSVPVVVCTTGLPGRPSAHLLHVSPLGIGPGSVPGT